MFPMFYFCYLILWVFKGGELTLFILLDYNPLNSAIIYIPAHLQRFSSHFGSPSIIVHVFAESLSIFFFRYSDTNSLYIVHDKFFNELKALQVLNAVIVAPIFRIQGRVQ